MGFTEQDLEFFREMEEEEARQQFFDWLSEQEREYELREAMKAWARSITEGRLEFRPTTLDKKTQELQAAVYNAFTEDSE